MQVVGYETAAGERSAALLVADDGVVERVALAPGTDLGYALGERRCAGVVADGRHRACDAEGAPYCDVHASRWPCARCTGDCDLPLDSCREEHAVYLAAFAPATFKVGVTRSWRLDTRLREQGADRAAHLRTVADGRTARRVEADVAEDVGDRVRVPQKLDLHRPVEERAWADLLAGFDPLATFRFDYGLDLDARPVAETMATGRVRGTKGRLVVLDRGGTAYAVDMRDLVGHEVTPGAGGPDRQSSLGAFGG